MMKKKIITLAISSLVAGAAQAAIVVQEGFNYADGNVAGLNGDIGWASAWEVGNSGTARFTASNNEGIYNAAGSFAYIAQNRVFNTPITVGVNDTVTLTFNLIRPETNLGRGIGIDLTNGGATQFFIGKEVNDAVIGLKAGMAGGSANYAEFATSGILETITATFTYDGTNTSIVMADSDEALAAYSSAGQFTFDGIALRGYNGSTLTNGVDNISIDVTTVPEPSSAALLGLGGLALIFRRRK